MTTPKRHIAPGDDLATDAQMYADAIDKDRGFETGVTMTLRALADELTRIQEQYKNLQWHYEAAHGEAQVYHEERDRLQEQLETAQREAERSEKYAEDRDLVAQRFEEQFEGLDDVLARGETLAYEHKPEWVALFQEARASFPATSPLANEHPPPEDVQRAGELARERGWADKEPDRDPRRFPEDPHECQEGCG